MSYIYVYDPDDDGDCSTIGLVGALMPTKCEFTMEAGAYGELKIEHPKDKYGKWKSLTDGAIVKTAVPCRLPPNISKTGAYITKVETWKVSATASKKDLELYKKDTGKSKVATLDPGQKVTYIELAENGNYVKVKADKTSTKHGRTSTKTYTGWIKESVLDSKVSDINIPGDSSGSEDANLSYSIQYQLFRIYNTQIDSANGGQIIASARRIPYDLLGNLCTYINRNADIPGTTVFKEILNNTIEPHSFKVYTDIADTRSAINCQNINPIEALLAEDDGAAPRWGAQVINDDYELYFLHRAGLNRGVRIEYAKNLTGIKCSVDTSEVAVAIRPEGKTEDGLPLYLTGAETLPEGYSFGTDKTTIYKDDVKDAYPIPKIAPIQSKATVSKDLKIDDARKQMVAEAVEKFDDGCDEPKITLTVEFVMLGNTEEYAQFRNLESLFVYDTVFIRHKPLGISSDISCVSLKWDCILDRPTSATFGELEDVNSSVASWQIKSASVGSASSGTVYDNSVTYSKLTSDCKTAIINSILTQIKNQNSDIAKAIMSLVGGAS